MPPTKTVQVPTSVAEVKFVSLDNPRGKAGGRVAPPSDKIVAAACRAKPGEFALFPLVGRKANSVQIAVNGKGTKAFPKGQFRVVQRKGVAYIAFVGKK